MYPTAKPITIAMALGVFLMALVLTGEVAGHFVLPLPDHRGPVPTRDPNLPLDLQTTMCPHMACTTLEPNCAFSCDDMYLQDKYNAGLTYDSCRATATTNHNNALENCLNTAGCQWINQELWCPSGTHQALYETCAATALDQKLDAEETCSNDYTNAIGQAASELCNCYAGCYVASGGCPEFAAP